MSRETTWLTLIFDDSLPGAWFTDPLFDEDDASRELAALQISTMPGKRERHVHFELERPLTAGQISGLSRLKELGLFSDFSLAGENTAKAPEQGSRQKRFLEEI